MVKVDVVTNDRTIYATTADGYCLAHRISRFELHRLDFIRSVIEEITELHIKAGAMIEKGYVTVSERYKDMARRERTRGFP